jgi:ABC-2 type transport system ATP-binding protein
VKVRVCREKSLTESIIHTEGLTCVFDATRAVDGLTIDVEPGTVYGFLGPNGSGKTTTIRMLLGLVAPTSGRARVLGFDATTESDQIRARCGALLEYSGIYERFSAEDNLEFYGRVWKMSASERRSRIREVLKGFGLWKRRGEKAGTWSRGMKQKLALARTLLHRPQLVFLDEPTAGLDPVAARGLREELGTLTRDEGITVFLTTHNLAEAEKLCSKVAVIRQGRLLAEGQIDTLRNRDTGRFAEVVGEGFSETLLAGLRRRPQVRAASLADGCLSLELETGSKMAPLVREMVAAGVAIEEVRKGRASLEEVFLTLMEESA